MQNSQILYLTGLPCSGMNLLNQILSQHPEVDSRNLQSPLCETLINLRSFLSKNIQINAHLSEDFTDTYERTLSAYRGLLQGWFATIDRPWSVDVSPNWLQHLELVHLLDPNYRMVVCIRELGQVYGAIEAQHQQSLLFDFPEQLADLSRSDRAVSLFSNQGVIGAPLQAIENLQNLAETLQQQLFYVVFEHLIENPTEVIKALYDWLDIAPIFPDLQQLVETLSCARQPFNKYAEDHYRFKQPLSYYTLPNRFEVMLQQRFSWFYTTFYPGQL